MAPFMPFVSEYVYQHLVRSVDPRAPESVHFADFPQVDETRIDAALEDRMAIVRSIVGLGRKLREDQKLKVRQPLATLTVVSRDARVTSAARATAALIADELNVKAVEFSADEATFCTLNIKPNFQALRERAAPKLKPIGEALRTWGISQIADLEKGKTLEVEGVAIGLGDVLLTRTPVAGSVVASAGDVTVVLDPKITPELAHEGLAREFTSVLQQARKSAGLEVNDRIRVVWQSHDPDVSGAIERHQGLIGDEVLAVAFVRRDSDSGTESAELNGRPVRFAIQKA
jgi:isoleucyl-tRNA synthetase